MIRYNSLIITTSCIATADCESDVGARGIVQDCTAACTGKIAHAGGFPIEVECTSIDCKRVVDVAERRIVSYLKQSGRDGCTTGVSVRIAEDPSASATLNESHSTGRRSVSNHTADCIVS